MVELGKFELALSDFEYFAEADTSKGFRYYYQIECLISLNRLNEAKKICEKALSLDPTNSELLQLKNTINDQSQGKRIGLEK